MMHSITWEYLGVVTAVLSTLVAAPLAANFMLLRSLREDQRAAGERGEVRLAALDDDLRRSQIAIEEVRGSYTTKEEWVRETTRARQQLDRLTELMSRIQAELEQSHGLATQFLRATNAIIDLAERLASDLRR